eukprot:318674_1
MATFVAILFILLMNVINASPNITCADGQDCFIDCSGPPTGHNCTAHTIIATTALSLTINCTSTDNSGSTVRGRCRWMDILCPNITTSFFKLDCAAFQCKYSTIYYPVPQNIYINCYGRWSCPLLTLKGPEIYSPPLPSTPETTATILCRANPNDPNDPSPYYQCGLSSFDVQYITNVNIICYKKSTYPDDTLAACYNAFFNVKYSKNVNLLCQSAADCQEAV